MTNLEWIKTLSAEEIADWVYDEWLPRLQYRWSSSRGGLIIWLKDRKDEPTICDFCRYYNSNIPCGSTPSACKKADKFAEEFVDALKKLKPKDEPTISKMEQVDKDINVRSKDEPTTQTKTQNSNLTFEKDECAKEYEELGLKELKELIESDRKTEPTEREGE